MWRNAIIGKVELFVYHELGSLFEECQTETDHKGFIEQRGDHVFFDFYLETPRYKALVCDQSFLHESEAITAFFEETGYPKTEDIAYLWNLAREEAQRIVKRLRPLLPECLKYFALTIVYTVDGLLVVWGASNGG